MAFLAYVMHPLVSDDIVNVGLREFTGYKRITIQQLRRDIISLH